MPDRDVIVTGGTGALGRAVVRAFVERGDRVAVPWIVDGERDAMERDFAAALRDERLSLVEADIAEPDGAGAVAAVLPAVEVLVHAAGGFAGGDSVAEGDLEVWDRMYRMNVRTGVAVNRAVLPGMLERGRGSIVHVASEAARTCPPGIAAYSASKAAVAVLTECLQREVAAGGVRVNAVVPTTIDTPANRAAMPDGDFTAWTPPERIASVILWLASDDASTVRGGLIPV